MFKIIDLIQKEFIDVFVKITKKFSLNSSVVVALLSIHLTELI